MQSSLQQGEITSIESTDCISYELQTINARLSTIESLCLTASQDIKNDKDDRDEDVAIDVKSLQVNHIGIRHRKICYR